jgi:hypothetical protein
MTVNEAAEAFRGEWIFMQVMEMDEHQYPVAGIVLAHHANRAGIQQTILDVIKDPPPDARGFFTYLGPRFRTTQEWRDYLQQERSAQNDGS